MNQLVIRVFFVILACCATFINLDRNDEGLTILEDEKSEERQLQSDEVWVNPCSGARDGCITPNSDLLYSVVLINQGVTLVSDRYLGSYKNVSLDTLTTKVDPFKITWTASNLDNYNIQSQLDRIDDKVKSLKNLYYKSSSTSAYDFLKGKIEEIAVVASSELKSYNYLDNFLRRLFVNFTSFFQATYDEKEFINGDYMPSSGTLKIPSLTKDQDLYSYGYAFNNCPKNKRWKNYSSTMKDIIAIYNNNTEFEAIRYAFSSAASKFALQDSQFPTQNTQASPIYYSSEGPINITIEYLRSNMTEMELLVDMYLADNAVASPTLNKNVIINDIRKVQMLSNFFKYDISTYSMLHCYLMIQPFLSRIESIFLEIINKVSPPTKYPDKSKLLIFSTNQYPFIALNKLFNYSTDKEKKKVKYFMRDTTRYIDYDTSIQFELWRNRTLLQESYFVTLREDFNSNQMNSTVVWSKTFPEFQSFLSNFYNSIEYNRTERQYFCE